MNREEAITAIECRVCGYRAEHPDAADIGAVRGNTQRFKNVWFSLWRCPQCASVIGIDAVDFQDIYSDYPLNKRRLDWFARATMANLVHRLAKEGVRKSDRILDYGCGNGLFVDFLRRKGYVSAHGYDPYVAKFSLLPDEGALYDCVVLNDVVEHVDDARGLLGQCKALLKSGGLLYIGTVESSGLDMRKLDQHVMRLHQPFHRLFLTERALHQLAEEGGMRIVRTYRRSYLDTPLPFANYRFLDEFSKALGDDMDRMLFDPGAGLAVVKKPALIFYGLLGYLFPSAYEPAALIRKP